MHDTRATPPQVPEADRPDLESVQAVPRGSRRRFWRRVAIVTGAVAAVYAVVAYVVMPALWVRYAHRHPAFDDVPRVTFTGDDIPADPINVALVGTEMELKKAMIAAKWYPADPLTFRSCLEIAQASVLKRPYDDAPVSNEYLWKRRQDLAFEQPVGDSPRHRHHVRFWRWDRLYEDRPVWVGSAVYDERVGINRDTGQVTHRTAPDIDAERDLLISDLGRAGALSAAFFIDNFHKVREGRNGEGNPWYTDGRLEVGLLKAK